jgi:hypothetical protein
MWMTDRKVTIAAPNGEDLTEEITKFARIIGLETAAPDRYSMLLVLSLLVGSQSGSLTAAKIVHEIQALEGKGRPSQLKPPTQFKRAPFKGLWHKHYSYSGIKSMAINIQKGLKVYGMPLVEQRTREAQEAGEKRYVSMDDVKSLTNDVVHGNWGRLAAAAELTGEWIIYAQHGGQNYYLCLGTHDKSRHKEIRQQIDDFCCLEFPFLSTLLSNA